MIHQRLNSGTKPAQFDWPVDLLTNYYQLGDSLKIILPQGAELQEWLDRCLFSDYQACPPRQLASWMSAGDTSEVHAIVQNLNLKAELALSKGLAALLKPMYKDDIRFDAMIPVISYADCPRAGVPFEANVFLAPYSTFTDNVKVTVNGKSVLLEKGLAHYETTVAASGLPKLNVQFIVTNPLTGETKVYSKEM
jgi:hypothetical protein